MIGNNNKEKDSPNKSKVIKKTLKLWFWSLLHLGRWYMPNIPEIKPEELHDRISSKESDKSMLLIDIREKYEVKKDGYIGGTTFFPYFNFPSHIHKISRNPEPEIITICPGGGASLVLAEILLSEGFKDVKSLKSGFKGYRKKKFPIIVPSTEQELDRLFTINEEHEVFLQDKSSIIIDHLEIDARNLSCPGPVLALSKAIKTDKVKIGEIIKLKTTDPGSLRDIPAWVVNTKQELLSHSTLDSNEYHFYIKRMK